MHRPSSHAALRRLAPAAIVSLAALVFGMAPSAFAAPADGTGAARARPSNWSQVIARPATPAGSRALGRVPSATVLDGAVALKPRDPAGLAAYASEVTTPRSPLYEHYLAPGQFADWFGPKPATIAAVEGHLRADGVRETGVSGNGLLVDFTAKAADAQAAFGTRLER